MVGLGETNDEIIEVMRDLRRHGVTMLTLGQYLLPSRHHLPVQRYVSPEEFEEMKAEAMAMGFTHAACGPFVRSSYHADLQAKGMELNNPPLPPLRAFFGAAALSASSVSPVRNSWLHLFLRGVDKATKAATINVAASSPYRQHPVRRRSRRITLYERASAPALLLQRWFSSRYRHLRSWLF